MREVDNKMKHTENGLDRYLEGVPITFLGFLLNNAKDVDNNGVLDHTDSREKEYLGQPRVHGGRHHKWINTQSFFKKKLRAQTS
jgi:hypothetical protein